MEQKVAASPDSVALQNSAASLQYTVWRERVTQWLYDVIDHLELPRETVYLAMNILDRYLASGLDSRTNNKADYEAAAITSLFLAVRATGVMDLKIPDLLKLSCSSLNVRDILSTGTRIMQGLTWNHRVPTPTQFVKALVALLDSSIDCETKLSIFDMSSYLVEISVYDQHLSGIAASKIAFAAMLVAIKRCQGCSRYKEQYTEHLLKVHSLTGMTYTSADIKSIYLHLNALYSQSQDSESSGAPSESRIVEDDSDHVHTTVESSPSSSRPRPVSPYEGCLNKRARLV